MKHKESELQQTCIKWFRLYYTSKIIFAIPNGGSRHVIEAARLKREGVLAGVADLCILVANSQYHALFIELKIGKGYQTINQKEFEQYCIKNDYQYSVCRSFDEFVKIVTDYIKC